MLNMSMSDPANFNFKIGSIAENVLHDLYYNYSKNHAFTTFWTIVLKICTNRLDYNQVCESAWCRTRVQYI